MANHQKKFHRFRRFGVKREDSLLEPAHFNAILYGQCDRREDVKLYRECSQLAYQTSIQNGGGHDCSDQKERCERSNVLGRDTSKVLSRERVTLQHATPTKISKTEALSRARGMIQRLKEDLEILKSRLEENPDSHSEIHMDMSLIEAMIADQEEHIRHIEAWP